MSVLLYILVPALIIAIVFYVVKASKKSQGSWDGTQRDT